MARVVILKGALRGSRMGGGSYKNYLVNTRRTGGPSGNCYGRGSRNPIVEIARLTARTGSPQRRETTLGTDRGQKQKNRTQQAAAGEPTHPQPVSDREVSIKKQNPQGLIPTGRMTYISSSYPCPSPTLAEAAEKATADHFLSNDPGGRSACLTAIGRVVVAGLTSFWCKSFATRREDKPHLCNNLFLANCRLR